MPLKILIIKTSALGDIVQAFSALESIKALHPDSQVDWVVEKRIRPPPASSSPSAPRLLDRL